MANEKELAKNIVSEMKPLIEVQKKEWITEVCSEVVPQVLNETFIKLGIDPKEPINMQKDFSHLRSARVRSEDVKKRITTEILRVCFVTAIAYVGMLYAAAKGLFEHH